MSEPIKALTLYQPYATLMALQEKRIETRSWATKHRGPLAIHASKSTPRAYREHAARDPFFAKAYARHGLRFEDLPRSRVLCIVNLLGCFRMEDELHKAAFVAGMKKISLEEKAFGNYAIGRYAWVTEFVRVIDDPSPTLGGQGLWPWLRGHTREQVKQVIAEQVLDRGETTL